MHLRGGIGLSIVDVTFSRTVTLAGVSTPGDRYNLWFCLGGSMRWESWRSGEYVVKAGESCFMDADIANAPPLGSLARMVGLNEYTLKTGFKKMFGMPVPPTSSTSAWERPAISWKQDACELPRPRRWRAIRNWGSSPGSSAADSA